MALVDLDNHIKTRFELIKLGGSSVKVYGHGAFREAGSTVLPSVAIERLNVSWNFGNARPFVDIITPSVEQITITVQDQYGGGELSGPQGYARTLFPTPVDVSYQVDLRAATRGHMDGLFQLVHESIPVGYRPKINGRYVTFVALDPVNLDELENPLFKTSLRYNVTDFYLDRLESETVPPITTIDFDEFNVN